ncbi:MAG: NADPH-dependent FMN reductase [Bacteroidota bacterium]|jgi:NAD(P)H-dependent FMN reductase
MKILAFGASNNVNSINQQLAFYTASLFENSQLDLLDINDFECPIYSPQRQKQGFPSPIIDFFNKMEEADLIIISFAEYNGSYTTAFKNIFDWISTYKSSTFEKCNFLLLSTSPGPRGGIIVLESALNRFPRHGATILGSYSLPSFNENFCKETNSMKEPHLSSLLKIVQEVKLNLSAVKNEVTD